jgi:hypothetical protein
MTAQIVILPDDTANTGKKVDQKQLTVGANTVIRQVTVLGDPTADNVQAVDASGRASVLLSGYAPSGLSKGKARDLGATPVALKAAAGTLLGLSILNNQGAAAYIQIFDVATGGVTPGTTNPDLEILVPANSQKDVVLPSFGVPFSTAITIISTTTEKGAVASAAGVQAFWSYL